MSWTDPRTWVTDEIVTSSLLNTHVRDNLKAIAHPYDYAPADVDVANTVTETSLWSKVITGGDLGANGVARVLLLGDVLKNNAAGDTCRLRVKFGGGTLLDDTLTFGSTVTSANRQPWRLEIAVANKGATNAQFIAGRYWGCFVNLSVPVAGMGEWEGAGNNYANGTMANTAAVDTTADQTFQITAQWSAASANNSFRRRLAVLHLGQN